MTDIKNTKEVIALLASLVKAIDRANEDGTINVMDLDELVSVFPKVIPAIEGIDEVPNEVKDIDVLELEEITELVAELIGEVAGDKYEEIGEQLFIAGVAITKAVKAINDETFIESEDPLD